MSEIVVGLDLSPSARAALRWAAEQARATGLHRRIDDPDLQLVDGTHPVVHAGVGRTAAPTWPASTSSRCLPDGGEADAAVALRPCDHALNEDPGAPGYRPALALLLSNLAGYLLRR
jgi:hypothetical protein